VSNLRLVPGLTVIYLSSTGIVTVTLVPLPGAD
jgi:hypothetical protein